MSMNIKNPEAHALAIELARRLDTSLTDAVTTALREKLATTAAATDGARQMLKAQLLEIGRTCANRLSSDVTMIDHSALLYDDLGLPK